MNESRLIEVRVTKWPIGRHFVSATASTVVLRAFQSVSPLQDRPFMRLRRASVHATKKKNRLVWHDCPISVDPPFYIKRLHEIHAERKSRNPRYSLRAYSNWLGLHPSSLCRIMKGKQELSERACARIVKKLDLAPEERERFLRSFVDHRAELMLGRLNRHLKTDRH